jgi:hypothetical protein
MAIQYGAAWKKVEDHGTKNSLGQQANCTFNLKNGIILMEEYRDFLQLPLTISLIMPQKVCLASIDQDLKVLKLRMS